MEALEPPSLIACLFIGTLAVTAIALAAAGVAVAAVSLAAWIAELLTSAGLLAGTAALRAALPKRDLQ